MHQQGLLHHEKFRVLLLAVNQTLYLVSAITVMTLSGVVGQLLAPSPGLATLPVAVMTLGTVFSTLPVSLLMKRIGRQRGFIIGTALGGTGAALCAFAIFQQSFALFVTGSLLLGVYQASAMYYRFAAAEAASDQFRSKAMSLVLAGGVISAFLGPWNASSGQHLWLVAAAPEAGPYLILVLLAISASLLLGLLRLPEPATAQAGHQRSMRIIASQPVFVVAASCAAVGYAIMILVMTATPIAMRQAGFGMPEAASVMQWHVLGMFAPSFFTGFLIARLGFTRMLSLGALMMAVAALVAASGQSYQHFLSALVMLGIGWNFLFVGGSNLLTYSHTPAERGKVQGINDLLVFSLVAIGSLLAGTLLYLVGWTGLSLAVLPVVVITLLLVLSQRRALDMLSRS